MYFLSNLGIVSSEKRSAQMPIKKYEFQDLLAKWLHPDFVSKKKFSKKDYVTLLRMLEQGYLTSDGRMVIAQSLESMWQNQDACELVGLRSKLKLRTDVKVRSLYISAVLRVHMVIPQELREEASGRRISLIFQPKPAHEHVVDLMKLCLNDSGEYLSAQMLIDFARHLKVPREHEVKFKQIVDHFAQGHDLIRQIDEYGD